MNRFLMAILLTGCAPPLNEENAAELTAKASCSKLKKCNATAYETYDSRADCVDDYEDSYQDAIDLLSVLGLELDVDEARMCLSDLKSATCEEWEDNDFSNDCDDVFTF